MARKNKILVLYKECFKFIWDSRKFFYFVLGIFLFSALIGYFVPVSEDIHNRVLDYLRELTKLIEGKSLFELISFIFANNFQSSLYGIFFGVFLGIFPVVSAFANGYILGFVSGLTVSQYGFFILWRLLPHGIFELPAIFISLTLGVKLGTFVFEKKKKEALIYYFKNSAKVFLFVVLPLLIVAAVIEGFLIFYSGS